MILMSSDLWNSQETSGIPARPPTSAVLHYISGREHLCDLSFASASAINGELDVAFNARVSVMLIIFLVSLFAVSFPSLSKRMPFLRIPRIAFFVGKHFGTGIILSTAFCHLLQDAFKALQDPIVKSRWHVENRAGLVILGSLLVIFLIEYISTSYVDHLQAHPSAPQSRESSPDPSRSPSRHPPLSPSQPLLSHLQNSSGSKTPSKLPTNPPSTAKGIKPSESTSLLHSLPPKLSSLSRHRSKSFSYGTHADNETDCEDFFSEGHHRHEQRSTHHSHHSRSLRKSDMFAIPALQGSRDDTRLHRHGHQPSNHGYAHEHSHAEIAVVDVKVGKKRQVIGILVLQLGIMIHSFVIGLTLAIVSTEFASLVTAIIFHQLFEGLSLGIRIASLPVSMENGLKRHQFLEPILSFLFAITTPAGILAGLLLFSDGVDGGRMKLTQGLMSAISAGMLIYSACVEMLAGDFIMDPLLWRGGVWKQGLALVSLFAGVGAMALVGA